MQCANCAAGRGIAYTLRTYVEGDPTTDAITTDGGRDVRPDDDRRTVDLHFCSAQCLRAWT